MSIFKQFLNEAKLVNESNEAGTELLDDISTEVQPGDPSDVKEFKSIINSNLITKDLVSSNKIVSKAVSIIFNKIKGIVVFPRFILVDGIKYAVIESKDKIIFFDYNNQNFRAYIFKKSITSFGKNVADYKFETDKLGLTAFFDAIENVMVNESRTISEAKMSPRMTTLLQIAPDILDRAKKEPNLQAFCTQIIRTNPNLAKLYSTNKKPADAMWYDLSKMMQNTALVPTGGVSNPASGTTAPAAMALSTTEGLTVTEDVSVDIAPIKMEDKFKEAYENQIKKYDESLETIALITEQMCEYVKGTMDDVTRKQFKRLMIISGDAGIGKTWTMQKILVEKGMREGTDYVKLGTKGLTVANLYKMVAQYPDKLIIMDDMSNIFNSANKVAFWQHMMDTSDSTVDAPTGVRSYHTSSNRRLNYYREVGNIDDELKVNTRWQALKKKMSDYEKKLKEYQDGGRLLDAENMAKGIEDLKKQMNVQREKIADNIVERLPDKLAFHGLVIIITNSSQNNLEDEVKAASGDKQWDSIRRRANFINLYPAPKVLWKKIKDTYQAQMDDTSVPDEQTVVPRGRWKEVCTYVEKALNENKMTRDKSGDTVYTCKVNYSMLDAVGTSMRKYPDKDFMWKNTLNAQMFAHTVKSAEDLAEEQMIDYFKFNV